MRAAFLLFAFGALRLDAQVVELPASFDRAAKVRSLTPALVARLELKPPVWPVEGDFVEARLFMVIGALPFIGGREDNSVLWLSATAGMLGGVALVERSWVRRYDHGSSDAVQTELGLVAGSLMGAAVAILARPIEKPGVLALLTGGGLVGALTGHTLAHPPLARGHGASNESERSERLGEARWRFDPTALALTVGGVPGRHALLLLRF